MSNLIDALNRLQSLTEEEPVVESNSAPAEGDWNRRIRGVLQHDS